MQAHDKDAFVKLLLGAAELYSKSLSEFTVRLYWQILQPYSLQEVTHAFEAHFADPDQGQFLPKPADIVRILKGSASTQSLEAWCKVEQAIRKAGPYHTVVFDDEIIHCVLQEMGGWIRVCTLSEKDTTFFAREFQNRYLSYRFKKPTVYPRKLVGLYEHQNKLNGFTQEHPPLLIGDFNKTSQILKSGSDRSNVFKIDFHSTMLALESKGNV